MGKKDPFALGPVQRRRGRRGGKTGRVREFFHGKLGGRENCAPGGVGPTKEGKREGGMEMSGNFMILWKHEGTAQSYRTTG